MVDKNPQGAPEDKAAAPRPPESHGGKGMPAKSPQARPPPTGRQTTQQDASAEASLELPNDRDQSTDMTPAEPDPVVKQAAKDVKRGLTDTSSGAETDRAYSKLRK
jgi:hypothetical protein